VHRRRISHCPRFYLDPHNHTKENRNSKQAIEMNNSSTYKVREPYACRTDRKLICAARAGRSNYC